MERKKRKSTVWISQSRVLIKECQNGLRVPLMLSYKRRCSPFPAAKGEAVVSLHVHSPCQDEHGHGEQVAVSHGARAVSHTQRGNVGSVDESGTHSKKGQVSFHIKLGLKGFG